MALRDDWPNAGRRRDASGLNRREHNAFGAWRLDCRWRPMTIRGGGDPNPRMASMPPCRMGLPLRSSAADAHYCIMVQILWIYRIQVCGAKLRANWRAPLRSSRLPSLSVHRQHRLTHDGRSALACGPTPATDMQERSTVPRLALDITIPIQVVGHRAGAALLHGQTRLGTVERLDLAFFVYAQHQRLGRRIEIEPNRSRRSRSHATKTSPPRSRTLLLDGRPLTAFEYRSLGTMASLGGRRGVADILGIRITGFLAWAAWRLLYWLRLHCDYTATTLRLHCVDDGVPAHYCTAKC